MSGYDPSLLRTVGSLAKRNRELVEVIDRLERELADVRQENAELVEANLNLAVERDAADVLLGAALDRSRRG